MRNQISWDAVFPLPKAQGAVKLVKACWDEMAAGGNPGFKPTDNERTLTVALCDYLCRVGRPRGVFGFWKAEPVGKDNGKVKEYRTDIEYLWMSESHSMTLVFEFKKIKKNSRISYKEGMSRFVTGPYSEREPVALMAGILQAPYEACVPSLRKALRMQGWVSDLNTVVGENGSHLIVPSELFDEADFDTEHRRSIEKAPAHGTIRISHVFLQWGPHHAMPGVRPPPEQIRQQLEGCGD